MWNKSVREQLAQKIKEAMSSGGEEKIKKQHASGKLTARERLECLFDKGSFTEVGGFVVPRPIEGEVKKKVYLGDGVVTGYGTVNGRVVYASSQDFTVTGGSLGENHSQKICKIMDMALRARAPFITINDSGGARIEEGINSLAGYSGIFLRNTRASGIIPQIAVIMGPCAGGACYSPAICDFVFMTEDTSQMFITGPGVVKTVTGEVATAMELGGAKIHSTKSGVSHFIYKTDKECIDGVKRLLSYLPQNNTEKAPSLSGKSIDACSEIEKIVPDNMKKAYDVRDVIKTFIDKDSFFEVQQDFAKNIVIGLARLDGDVIGIVANQPSVTAGTLDVDASDKAARFIRFCDCFEIPILSLVDVPGYMPGTAQEHSGIIRHGAKLLYAYSEATVPKISLIMRKAYGGAYIAMNSKNMGADLVFAWPIAQIAVMGSEGAVDILYKRELSAAEDKESLRAQLVSEYEEKYLNPYIASANGYIDEVIAPEDTKKRICKAFEALKNKKEETLYKKHGNIPL